MKKGKFEWCGWAVNLTTESNTLEGITKCHGNKEISNGVTVKLILAAQKFAVDVYIQEVFLLRVRFILRFSIHSFCLCNLTQHSLQVDVFLSPPKYKLEEPNIQQRSV